MTSSTLNLVQDIGRFGLLSQGVSRSGAMDPQALRVGNALLGNAEGAAGIEINVFPIRVRFAQATGFACTGADCPLSLDDTPTAGWTAQKAFAGQTLTIQRPRRGTRAYLCFTGGIDVEPVMASRATDLKGGFGGFSGRSLQRGDRLTLGTPAGLPLVFSVAPAERRALWQELATGSVKVRVLPGAEYQAFTTFARQQFIERSYVITADSNRVGYRLSGEALALTQPLELRSHGILPGTVQVPPAGQPIIQMAEANTCGGYPKIANVIEADLWRLAQAPIGTRVLFSLATRAEALTALQHSQRPHTHSQ